MNSRKTEALKILTDYFGNKNFKFLGQGSPSVVFHDHQLVYKVFMLDSLLALNHKQYVKDQVKLVRDKFDNSRFFYPIKQIVEIAEKRFVIIYPYEQSEPCTSFDVDEIQDFLVECWQKRLIFQDLKPANFIRVMGSLKWIDYEPDKFTDNLFLNMVARAYVYATYKDKDTSYLNKLCRSAINQFDIPELNGMQQFANRVYAKIIFQESIFTIAKTSTGSRVSTIDEIQSEGYYAVPYNDSFNAEKCFWQLKKRNLYLSSLEYSNPQLDNRNYFSPEHILIQVKELTPPIQQVSLVIKTCVQDAEVLYQAVRHIVKQLSLPNSFHEVLLALDIRKNDFLREYNSKNSWELLIAEAQRLIDDSIIDNYIYPQAEDVLAINREWSGLETNQTHTIKKVPLTAQLFAFEKAQCDYVLQVDCDAMIGRQSTEHSFLNDMISELQHNDKALTVGFNIYKGAQTSFTPYFGFENGGFVPEVRFCLLQKSRFKRLLPLKNSTEDKGFSLSWYRSLEMMQKESGYCSIRGGHSHSFFIHPQNYRKANNDLWFTIIDRTEQLQIPEKQAKAFDLTGSYFDWAIPKRNEKMVIVSCLRSIPLPQFLRYWLSLISQTFEDWGLILIDDASDNGISYFIKEMIKPFAHKVTFIENRFRMGVAHNTYKAIHYFMQNHKSVVCIIDADDALLGKRVLENIFEKYSNWNADVVVGKMYRTDKIHPHYKYTPNFVNPRLYGGNVWQHIRSFKKYLFDSLNFYDLKIENKNYKAEDVLLSKRFKVKMKFPEHCWDYTYMIPIVEMCANPIWINHFNILHDRSTINTPEIRVLKNNIIAEILAKPAKTPKDIIRGRKTFLPNTNKIELDITYDCNLKCFHCNRSCTQAPTEAHMTLQQVQQFVKDSVALGKQWELINVLGGEPTLHPQFAEIVHCLLYDYLIAHSPSTTLQITSNGYGEDVQQKLAALPKHPNLVVDYNSFKDDRTVPYFTPFNLAPADEPDAHRHEYHKGCWVTAYCGIGLNNLGYFACGVAGGIERILKAGKGINSLEELDDRLIQQLDTYCRLCGNFTAYAENRGDFMERAEKDSAPKTAMSESWQKLYKQYNHENA